MSNEADQEAAGLQRAARLEKSIEKITKLVKQGVSPSLDTWSEYAEALREVMWDGRDSRDVSFTRLTEPQEAYRRQRASWEREITLGKVNRLLGAVELHTSTNALLALLVCKAYEIDPTDVIKRALKARGIDA